MTKSVLVFANDGSGALSSFQVFAIGARVEEEE